MKAADGLLDLGNEGLSGLDSDGVAVELRHFAAIHVKQLHIIYKCTRERVLVPYL